MKVTNTVDLNSHLSNLSVQVLMENDEPFAYLRFHSSGKRKIIAVKLTAEGFNLFNDALIVKGRNSFEIILQDLSIPVDSDYISAKISLPNKEIRRLKVHENQVVYDNLEIVNYQGPNLFEYSYDLLDETDPVESEMLNAIRDFEEHGVCIPQKIDSGWICVCGQFNIECSQKCSQCSNERDQVLAYSNRTILENYGHQQQEDKRLTDVEKTSGKKKKKKILLFSLICATAIPIIVIITNALVIASRVTYNSVREMQNDLKGSWVYRSSYSDSVLWAIEISSDKLVQTYNTGISLDTTITYHPLKGYFNAWGDKYIVKNANGSMILKTTDGYTYERGDVSDIAFHKTSQPNSGQNKFNIYLDENNIQLNCSDVQYNMSNNLDEPFSLVGYAKLDDYYNYGFSSDLEPEYFCLAVTPKDGSYSNMWYIYCHRDSFQSLFDKVKDEGSIYVQMVCKIPRYRFEKNQQCMASLEFVVY